jgi:hypothetical protein
MENRITRKERERENERGRVMRERGANVKKQQQHIYTSKAIGVNSIEATRKEVERE